MLRILNFCPGQPTPTLLPFTQRRKRGHSGWNRGTRT